MLFFMTYNWDFIAIAFVVIAFCLIQKNQKYLAAFFLALGALSKFYPVIYLLPLLLQEKKPAEWLKIVGIFGLTVLLVNLPFMFLNWNGWAYFFTLNSLRNSNPDSIWTIFRFVFRGLDAGTINKLSLFLFGLKK